MEDRSNIIKEAIEYRDKLEKKVEELAQSVVRLQISLDFADNTIKKKDKENAELKAYKDVNEDFKKAWEELKAENEKLYEEKDCLHKIIDRLLENAGYSKDIASAEDFEDVYENMQYKNNKLEEYKQTLQEIKAIAKDKTKTYDYLLGQEYTDLVDIILQLITKAESEEV